ncbi:MAG: UbiD family decarboxylase [Chloroflexi bacterium]|nr:UbiD family decarboxylase [Chloroflexota bacterium]
MPLNYGEDELAMAGALRGSPVPLVRGKTVPIMVPANAEFVFEGWISPDDSTWLDEGPFGEYTGYYGGELSKKPTVQLTAITHHDNPILQGTLEGPAPNESDVLIGVGGAVALKVNLAKMGVPGIKDVWTRGRTFIAIVSLERHFYSGHARQVIDAALALNWGFKWIIVVDADIDVFNWEQVDWALSTRVQPHRDIVMADNRPRIEPRPVDQARMAHQPDKQPDVQDWHRRDDLPQGFHLVARRPSRPGNAGARSSPVG